MEFLITANIDSEDKLRAMNDFINLTGASAISVQKASEFLESNVAPLVESNSNSKYGFDVMKLGHAFKIPDDVKLSTMRVIVSRWHKDNENSGKRFRVYANDRSVARIK